MSKAKYQSISRTSRFWIPLALTLGTDLLVFSVQENLILSLVRWGLTFTFSIFVPGYCLLILLFPRRELDAVETICVSVGLSFAILSIVGLFTNFMMGSIAIQFLMPVLSIVILAFVVASVLRTNFEETS
jgi:uncharacterized membrane protein